MNKYEKLKQKYDTLIKKKLEENKGILIESFVEYYGEEHRYLIERKYEEIVFCYYIYWETIDILVEDLIPRTESKKNYKDLIKFYNCHKKSFFQKLFSKKNKQDDIPDNLVGITDSSALNNVNIKNELRNILKDPNPSSWNYGSIKKMRRLVSFQLCDITEEGIIHEINHALTRENLLYNVYTNKNISAIEKGGLSLNDNEEFIEELLNEKASIEIANIFKRRGGDLSSIRLGISAEYSFYECNFYLIDDFYDAFKEYIKIARISDNKNALVERIGKKEYEEFVQLINRYYSEDLDTIKRNKEEALPKIKALVETMKNNLINSHELTKAELDSYYNELRNKGYHVNVLNDSESEDITLESAETPKR